MICNKNSEETYCKDLKTIYESGELSEDSTCANFAQVVDNGKTYQHNFYSLSAIIAVGYRINSHKAILFRKWAIRVPDAFTKQCYILDKSKLIGDQIWGDDYFEHLISEIQEIRASERRFYQKITGIYVTLCLQAFFAIDALPQIAFLSENALAYNICFWQSYVCGKKKVVFSGRRQLSEKTTKERNDYEEQQPDQCTPGS